VGRKSEAVKSPQARRRSGDGLEMKPEAAPALLARFGLVIGEPAESALQLT
jgi:hypothetical protein